MKMPSLRRIKVFGLLLFLFALTLFFYAAQSRQHPTLDTGDFYGRTVNALNKQKPGGDEEVAAAMAKSLKDAAKLAKDNANAKAPKPNAPSEVVGVGSAAGERGVAGRKKFTTGGDAQVRIQEEPETEEQHRVEVELNSILKRSPIIIFSKSYCPHSKQAKNILLEKYIIDPAPYVVELDQHEIGQQLQASLAELTGRKTVPNVLINGVSIGGGDDIAELDDKKTLVAKVKDLGGKRMLDVRERPAPEEEKKEELNEQAEPKREPHGLRV